MATPGWFITLHIHTHTHTIARQTGNNSVSECQNPRQLDIKQYRACPTPIGAFLQYRARGHTHTRTHTHLCRNQQENH